MVQYGNLKKFLVFIISTTTPLVGSAVYLDILPKWGQLVAICLNAGCWGLYTYLLQPPDSVELKATLSSLTAEPLIRAEKVKSDEK